MVSPAWSPDRLSALKVHKHLPFGYSIGLMCESFIFSFVIQGFEGFKAKKQQDVLKQFMLQGER